MRFFNLYIDPGTGSALFSIIIGIAAAAYFLARGIFIKIKILLFKKTGTNQFLNKYVIYAEDKRYWNFFELILEEIESRQIEVLYLTSSEDDPVFCSNYNYIKGKYIGGGNKAFAYLNFLSASFLLTTTPELNVLQWKRSKNVKHYCHFIHAAGGPSMYKLFALDYFDSILLSSEIDMPEIRELEKKRNLAPKQLIVVGNTFFDNYIKKINHIPAEDNHIFTVLVSPSWGEGALLNNLGEKLLDPLVKTGWRIIVRPHPQSLTAEKPLLDKLAEKYKNSANIEWDYNHENIYSLSKADVMISDFSGIIYDYVFLFDRPVIINIDKLDLRRYDAYYLAQTPYFLRNMKEIGLELDKTKLDSIKDTILELLKNTEYQNNRRAVKNQMWRHAGESAKRIVDFMIKTAEEESRQ